LTQNEQTPFDGIFAHFWGTNKLPINCQVFICPLDQNCILYSQMRPVSK